MKTKMKNSYWLLLACVPAFSLVFAQDEENREVIENPKNVEWIVVNKDGVAQQKNEVLTQSQSGNTTKYYDWQNRLVREVSINSDGTTYIRDGYSYDSDGNLLSFNRTQVNEDGTVRNNVNYGLDENGNMNWKSYQYNYYDGNGNLTQSYSQDYTRDINGRTISLDRTWYNADGSAKRTEIYNYDRNEDGSLLGVSQSQEAADGSYQTETAWSIHEETGKWVAEEQTRQYFDEDGNLTQYFESDYDSNEDGFTTSLDRDWYDPDDILLRSELYEYDRDEDNNLLGVVKTNTNADDQVTSINTYGVVPETGRWYTEERTYNYYDEDGTLTKSYDDDYENNEEGYSTGLDRVWTDADGVITKTEDYDYTRDTDNKLTDVARENTDANGNSISTTTYLVNDAGKWLTQDHEYNYYDDSGNILRTYSQDYEYDENNYHTKLNRTWTDDEGNVTSNNEYNYTRDSEGRATTVTNVQTNVDGNTVTSSSHEYATDPVSGKWLTQNYTHEYFDADGNKTQSYDQQYTYDANGKSTQVTRQWNDSDGVLSRTEDIDYVRDASGQVSEQTSTRKDLDGNVTSRTEYTNYVRDSSGRQLSYIATSYNAENAITWKGVYTNWTYDTGGSWVTYEYQFYNSSNSMYDSGTKNR